MRRRKVREGKGDTQQSCMEWMSRRKVRKGERDTQQSWMEWMRRRKVGEKGEGGGHAAKLREKQSYPKPEWGERG